MAVDLLRSCYTTQMAFYGDPTQLASVTWFFVPDGTPFLPYPTPFNSPNWDPDPQGGRTLGELDTSVRGYYAGGNFTSATGTGPPCGTADQWLNGQPAPPATPTPVDSFGTPTCCPRQVGPFVGGFCSAYCKKGAASLWTVGPINVSVQASGYDLTQYYIPAPLPFVSQCQWKATFYYLGSPYTYQFVVQGDGSVGLTFINPNSQPYTQYTGQMSKDCNSPVTLFLEPIQITPLTWPNTITVYPGNYVNPLIGSLIWDCGVDAVPSLYLLCDGRAVSRVQYSLLFGRISTTFGAGDGSSTFNLPNLLGRVLVGSGGSYATGQQLGNDSPTLTANQLPAHTHPVTDPGHTHAPGQGGTVFALTDGAGPTMAPGSGSRAFDAQNGLTASNITGLTVGNNSTTGNPLDVRQAGLALRPLIYAGQ